MTKTLSIALRSSTAPRRMLIAVLLCSVLNAVLFDALIAIVMHRLNIVLLASSIGASEIVAMAVLLYWMAAQSRGASWQ
jgi:Na+-driven multidrug efflux pump